MPLPPVTLGEDHFKNITGLSKAPPFILQIKLDTFPGALQLTLIISLFLPSPTLFMAVI